MMRLPHQFLNLPLIFGILDSGGNIFHNQSLLFYTIAFLLSSIVGFFLNDYIDSKDTDQLSIENRVTKNFIPNRKTSLEISLTIIIISLIFYALSSVTKALPIGIVTLILMYAYSVPPLRLKRFPYIDIILQIIVWAVIPYFMPYYLLNSFPFSFVPFVFMFLFFLSTAAIAPILDISADKKAHIFNTTVRLGYQKSLRFSFWILVTALTIGLYIILTGYYFWYWLMLPPGMIALGVFGYALGNVDRPEKIEYIFLRAKKWATLCGLTMFLICLSIIIIDRNIY